MRKTPAIIVAIVSMALPQFGLAEELTDPSEILKRADEACRKVEAASYSVVARSTAWLESRVPSSEGEVVVAGKVKGQQDVGKFRVKARTRPPGGGEAVELVGGSDGENFFLIDSATKTVYEDIDPAVMGRSARAIQSLIIRPFVDAEPFTNEFKAEKLELKETADVDGESCYQVHITYADAQGEAVYFFSKKDLLPRRRDRIINNPEQGKATRELIISKLQVNPALPDSTFKAEVPEGYKKTDDFAP